MTEENTQNQVATDNVAPQTAKTVPETTPIAETPAAETVPAANEEPTPEEVTPAPVEEIKDFSNIRPGMTVRVHQKIKETNSKGEEKERIQVYEGMVIAHKHGNEAGATITVRKTSDGIGVEKIFPLYSPNVAKLEVVRQAKVRRSKLFFLRDWKKRLREKIIKK